jgi:hypothetical protein
VGKSTWYPLPPLIERHACHVLGQFGVGRENGTLFTKKRLDRETTASYDLIVIAIDQAESPSIRRSSTTQVKSDRI